MTAPALNLVPTAAPGAVGSAVANAATQAGGAATGFDALIAALFPTGAPAPGATSVGATAVKADGEEVADAVVAESATPDAATTLAAAAILQVLPAGEAPPAANAEGEAPAASRPAPAHGQGRPAFAPLQGLPPGQATAEGASPDAVGVEDGPPPATDPPGKAGPHAEKAAPPAFGRDKPHGAPAQPALDNANPKADLAAKAAAAGAATDTSEAPPAPPAPDAATTTAADAAESPVLTAQAARPEPTPGTAKPGKAERKGAPEGADAPGSTRPAQTGDKPLHAKAPQAPSVQTANQPASDTVEAVEPQGADQPIELDQPEASPQGETRAAQGSAAAAHEAHTARGAPETVANLAAQIVRKLEAKTTRFDLELDPHGLGRVDVRVEIGAHGKMTASMVFESPQAAHELKSRAAELQRVLEQAGFDLSGGLSFDVADQGRQQGQAWQDQTETGLGFRGQAFRAALETAGEAADAATTGALRLRRGVNAGVDVRI